ncbi:BnaAnng41950D [Brassica napus]|uniref:BnaAnng41950D protein n=1 Tax=Brassica napus TaxID=3708 RepID=A0A078K442_BRANA|nr:BnaAnng41950D [Brassica napus]
MDGSCSDAKLLEQIRTVSRLKKRRTSPAGD